VRNNVKVLSLLLIITCAACGQVPQPFQKTELQKAKDTKLLAPSSRSLFVKGINGPVGWVGNAFAKATAHVLRGKGLLASSTWQTDQSFALTANGYQQLYEDRPPDLIVTWLLTDNMGRVKKTLRTKSTPPREFWINPTMQTFRQVIAPKANKIIAWLNNEDKVTYKQPQSAVISIGAIKGLTAEKEKIIRSKIAKILEQHKHRLSNKIPEKLLLKATIQNIFLSKFSEKIIVTWTLTSQNGFDIGNIKQENIVEKVRLDNNWAEISNQIARGAIDGILDLVQAYSASKRQS
jgi:hypothetical protein|tara:strand:+ start:9074 stop:9949 length:876 start_codon:yes stop_codon:yes gene_type:complete